MIQHLVKTLISTYIQIIDTFNRLFFRYALLEILAVAFLIAASGSLSLSSQRDIYFAIAKNARSYLRFPPSLAKKNLLLEVSII